MRESRIQFKFNYLKRRSSNAGYPESARLNIIPHLNLGVDARNT
jgi:hypothetical protein